MEVDQADLVNVGQYNVQDAKTRLSELLNLVERGEDDHFGAFDPVSTRW